MIRIDNPMSSDACDDNRIVVLTSFTALFVLLGRIRPTGPREHIAQR